MLAEMTSLRQPWQGRGQEEIYAALQGMLMA